MYIWINKSTVMKILSAFLSSFLFMFWNLRSNAQVTEINISPVATQAVMVELGGTGLIATFNYDSRFSRTSPDGLGAKVGIGGIVVSDYSIFTIPVMVNYLAGKHGKYFEAGIGGTYSNAGFFAYASESFDPIIGSLYFGYRGQPEDGGFVFRIGLCPVFGNIEDTFFFIPYYGGISFGYAF